MAGLWGAAWQLRLCREFQVRRWQGKACDSQGLGELLDLDLKVLNPSQDLIFGLSGFLDALDEP